MMCAMAYPIALSVERQLGDRNRPTVAGRVILAIPHLLLVGGVGLGFAANRGHDDWLTFGGESGLLGGIALVLAIVSWFTIVIASEHYTPIRRYTHFYLRWRVRSLAYLMLLADQYPPFGDGPYPFALQFTPPAAERDRLTVALRLIVTIPHFVVLFFVLCAWWIVSFVAWIAILLTGRYPEAFYDFSVGALRWLIRVEAYFLLLIDDYPPFSLSS
jgi:Domain of unknown function (DUF4389)